MTLTREQVEAWAEYQGAPWGRLRLDLTREILARHVPTPKRVLDVGCGFGEISVELAHGGSEVIASDASEAMVTEAEARSPHAPVEWVVLDVADAAERFAGERFDLILCHSVLPYVDEPAAAVEGLATLLSAAGSLSIMVLNRLAEPLRQAFLVRDLDAALAAAEQSEARRQGATLGVEVRSDSPDDVKGWIDAANLQLEALAGLMLVNHYLGARDEAKATPEGYDTIRRLELALCERDPYRQIAPFLHVIARQP